MREPCRVDIVLKLSFESLNFQISKRVLQAKAKLHIVVILLKALDCQSLIHSPPIIPPKTLEQSVPAYRH